MRRQSSALFILFSRSTCAHPPFRLCRTLSRTYASRTRENNRPIICPPPHSPQPTTVPGCPRRAPGIRPGGVWLFIEYTQNIDCSKLKHSSGNSDDVYSFKKYSRLHNVPIFFSVFLTTIKLPLFRYQDNIETEKCI